MLERALGSTRRGPPERIASLVEELGLPASLREVGVPEEDFGPSPVSTETVRKKFGDPEGCVLRCLDHDPREAPAGR